MCHLNWIIVAQSVMSQIHKKNPELTFSWRAPLCLCEGRSSAWGRRTCRRWSLTARSRRSVEETRRCGDGFWTKTDSRRGLTFPLGRPRSLRAWKIPFSVFPDAKVRVMLEEQNRHESWRLGSAEKWFNFRSFVLPSDRNLSVYVRQETHFHPTRREQTKWVERFGIEKQEN